MDQIGAQILLFVSLCQWMAAELAKGMMARAALGASIQLILCPAILSGTMALLVKYLVAIRSLPIVKLASGSLLDLLVNGYIDRICRNNSYLLVRSVGLAIIVCSALGVFIIKEGGFAGRRQRVAAEVGAAGDYGVTRD